LCVVCAGLGRECCRTNGFPKWVRFAGAVPSRKRTVEFSPRGDWVNHVPERIYSVSGNTEHPRLRTRVKGLDRLLDGGLLAGDAYLVSGGPGTGKTTLGNQLAFLHAAAGESVVIFMLQTEPHEWMLAH